MKILFIADIPLGYLDSGAERVLISQAVGLVKEEYDVYAITRRNSCSNTIEYSNNAGIREGCYGANTLMLLGFLFAIFLKPTKILSDFSNKKPFSAVICHQPYTCFPLLFLRKLGKIPLLYVFHSPNHEEYLLTRKKSIGSMWFPQVIIRQMVERFCLKRSKKVLVLSHYMKKRVMDIHRIPEDLIEINPGGVDLSRFEPAANRKICKQMLFFPPGKVHLLTIRNLEARMGLDNLLTAIAKLKDQGISIHLTIGGEGPEKIYLESLIKRYGLSDDICLTGYIPAEQLPRYYCAADFFILPTRHLEGFGLVTIESLACGTPVLGTPVGGTKEILANFHSNFLFKDPSPNSMAIGIHSAINEIYKDNKKYDQLRQRCREYAVANYSWQRHVSQLKSVIDELSLKKEFAN